MRALLMVMAASAALVACSGEQTAQTDQAPAAASAQAALSPPPVINTADKDAQGRPLPFGYQAYQPPETPLGSGAFKAVMEADPSLPEHIVYHPADIAAAGKLPVVAWGNGACIHAGNRFRGFLTEIASHGILVISAGTMGHQALEVGAQENPRVLQPGETPPPPTPPVVIPNDPTAQWRATRSNVDHLKQAIDWAIAENARPDSKYFGKIDTTKIGVGGQSCGGGLATQAAADPRVTALGMFNSGTRLAPNPNQANNPDAPTPAEVRAQAIARLDAIHTPTLYVTGDAMLDTAFTGGKDSFGYLTKVPVFYAWQEGLQHIGTYGQPNGGSLGRIGAAWYAWQLRGDAEAGKMFSGADCVLCKEPTWQVQKKNMQ